MKKVLFDTNILVAGTIEGHQEHKDCFPWMLSVKQGQIQGFISTHAIAEFYGVMTRLPLPHPPNPQHIYHATTHNLAAFHAVDLKIEDYLKAIRIVATLNITLGGIDHALIAQVALREKVDFLLTLTPQNFTGWQTNITIKTPDKHLLLATVA
ncbi:MAG: PIN domain-containing protein [Oscillatoriales cyanobacterium SM2_2_1]|nr:PIN domain-containing protein [Oscillatoriales cyanobacterium SM2_2_1]